MERLLVTTGLISVAVAVVLVEDHADVGVDPSPPSPLDREVARVAGH